MLRNRDEECTCQCYDCKVLGFHCNTFDECWSPEEDVKDEEEM